MAWLSEEARGAAIAGYVVLAALMVVSLDQTVEAALENWGLVKASSEVKSPFKYLNTFLVADLLVLGPLMEELMFRILPLSLVIAFVSRSPGFVFGAMTLFTVLFGAIHPYTLSGKIEAGIAGFFFGLVFLKCGGLKKSFLKASAAAIAAHGTTNCLVLLYLWWRYLVIKS